MSAESQLSIHDQLLESTAAIPNIIDTFGSTEVVIIDSLREGLKSLQDTLLGYGNMPTPVLYPLYKLCLHLWQNFGKQLQQSLGNASELARISVVDYDLCHLRKVLLSISHALCTYLNLIRCSTAKVGTAAQQRCMSCVACAIRDLDDHLTHLECLDTDELVSLQLHLTKDCLLMYCELLRDLGIGSYPRKYCECIMWGSNRTRPWLDDIVIIRFGQDVMQHCSKTGAQLLENIARKKMLGDNKALADLMKRYEDTEERLRIALSRLRHDEDLVSFETLTRGYRLKFGGMSADAMERLGYSN